MQLPFGFDPTTVFDTVATDYRDARPGYPDALYRALDELVGGLDGTSVADIGAGTGIASAALAARGATVLAVEPSLAMLGGVGLPAVSARAEAMPLRAECLDLVTSAQAWHWVDAVRAVPECGRVLRRGGHLALWWNVSDSEAPWLSEVQAVGDIHPYGLGVHQDDPATLLAGGVFSGVQYRDIAWRWIVPIDRWLASAATRSSSVIRVRRGGGLPVQDLRDVLHRHFPDGEVSEIFTCHLALAKRGI